MTITAIFRDFLRMRKIRGAFEKNVLANHPEYGDGNGHINFKGNHYVQTMKSITSFNIITPHMLIGDANSQGTFVWDDDTESGIDWYQEAYNWNAFLRKCADSDSTIDRYSGLDGTNTY